MICHKLSSPPVNYTMKFKNSQQKTAIVFRFVQKEVVYTLPFYLIMSRMKMYQQKGGLTL